MSVVYNLTLAIRDRQELHVPLGAQFLHVQEQNGRICIWYKCDPTKLNVVRTILIVGTGHALPYNSKHISTILTQGGALVWHFFEETNNDF